MVVEVDALAIALLGLLACIVALAITQLARNIAEALLSIISGTVGKVWLIGSLVDKGVNWVEQHLVNAMTDIINGLEGNVGFYWHALGNLATSIGNEIVGLSAAFDSLAAYVIGVVRPWVVHTILGGLQHGVKWLRHELTSTKVQVFRIAKQVEHAATGTIGGAVHTITKPLAAELSGLERWTHTRVGAIEHALDDVIPREIAGLRGLTDEAQRVLGRLWAQVRRLDRVTSGALATALVLSALARIGAGWVACRNWNKVGRSVCRLPFNFLDDLLGLLTDFVVLTSICQVLPWLEDAFSTIAEPFIAAFVDASLTVCWDESLKAPKLPVPTLYLPAAVDATLHLP